MPGVTCRHLRLCVSTLVASLLWGLAVNAAPQPQLPDGTEPWIVMFKKGVDGQQLWDRLCPSISIGDDPVKAFANNALAFNSFSDMSTSKQLLLNCTAHFNSLLNGFAGHFTLKQLDQIKAQYKNSIDFVISDKLVQVDTPKVPAGSSRRRLLAVQEDPTWGLDLIDQGSLPLDENYHFDLNGTGVNVYVLDTGIRLHHAEFKTPGSGIARVFPGFDAVTASGEGTTEDCHGHGSHVAAVIGGNTFGVAKNVTMYAVRVLDCQGKAMLSSLIKGLEWVAKNHVKPAVVHMSVEGGFSSLVNKAIEQLMKSQHVHVVVSAGNSGQDACRASPASTPGAVTVGAIDQKMQRWAYSNWGACVDIFAPGVSILSAISSGDNSTGLKTGTSMAAPFVTGVVAAYLGAHPGASPDEIQEKLYQQAVRNAVADDPQGFATLFPADKPLLLDISSTPNRLLVSNVTAQAHLAPGVLDIKNLTSVGEIRVTLVEQPSAPVTVQVTVPNAWDGNPLADVYPATLTINPAQWDQPQTVALHPKLASEGDYYVNFKFYGEDSIYPALHTVLVQDSRKKSGDSAEMARVISQLPFNDTGDSSTYTDNYGCQVTDKSPDVVYRFTAPYDMDVIVSTCGSGYDTKLIVSMNLDDPSSYLCNDDDRGCASNTACSRLDVSFRANHTYFIVVDGYGGAAGEYTLSLTCPRCPDTTKGNPNGLTAPLIAALMQISMDAQAANAASGSAGDNTSTVESGHSNTALSDMQEVPGVRLDASVLSTMLRGISISSDSGTAKPVPTGHSFGESTASTLKGRLPKFVQETIDKIKGSETSTVAAGTADSHALIRNEAPNSLNEPTRSGGLKSPRQNELVSANKAAFSASANAASAIGQHAAAKKTTCSSPEPQGFVSASAPDADKISKNGQKGVTAANVADSDVFMEVPETTPWVPSSTAG